jgi:hypothetical protein
MRHRVDADAPTGDAVIKMWNGDVKPLLACGRTLAKVVNFYEPDELPGGYACSKCFLPAPALPEGTS